VQAKAIAIGGAASLKAILISQSNTRDPLRWNPLPQTWSNLAEGTQCGLAESIYTPRDRMVKCPEATQHASRESVLCKGGLRGRNWRSQT
jgi:hypothetical protein